jgi:peptidoglycan/xylan/chitin deacetylase (PgdA/CDA1 family)
VPPSRRIVVAGLLGAAGAPLAACAVAGPARPVAAKAVAPAAEVVPPVISPLVVTPTPALTPSLSAVGGLTRDQVVARYGPLRPDAWSLDLPGMVTTVPGRGPTLALTFDACGGPGGSGYDAALIATLRRYAVPATLFLNGRWIAANRSVAAELAADPLFEIGNHGTRHMPLSTTGRSAYGIQGTHNVGEVYDEVAGNRATLSMLLGAPPRYFRPGTAYCDNLAVRIVEDMDETVVSFAVNGDAGATYPPARVTTALLTARPGSVVIAHMNHPTHGTAAGVAAALPRLLGRGVRFTHLTRTA